MVGFTHLDARGHARMVDVSSKLSTRRLAVARSKVAMAPASVESLFSGSADAAALLQSARIAAILAAKRTSEIIPLCHSLPVAPLTVEFAAHADHVEVTTTARTDERTGVEMEALVGCSIAAMTLYASVRRVDESAFVDGIALWEKVGGKSGHWRREH